MGAVSWNLEGAMDRASHKRRYSPKNEERQENSSHNENKESTVLKTVRNGDRFQLLHNV